MADGQNADIAASPSPAASSVSEAAPVTPAAPAPSPAPESVAAPAVTSDSTAKAAAEVPAAAPIPATTEAKPVEPKQAEAPAKKDVAEPPRLSEAKSILGDAKTKAEEPAKAETVKAEGESKTAEGDKPAEATAEKPAEVAKPTFEAFKLPEGVEVDQKQLSEFTDMLSGFEVEAKADHAKMQEFGQKLLDRHVSELTKLKDAIQQNQRDTWSRLREQWTNEFINDPEIGGNRQDTTIKNCGAVLESYGSKFGADREANLRYALRISGMDNHPEMIRFFDWASRYSTERGIKPVPAVSAKPPATLTPQQRRYPTLRNNGAA